MPSDYQKAVLAAKRELERGNRIIVSSRWFWYKHGFPLPDMRREIVRAARAMVAVSDQIEAGSSAGTIADLYNDRGISTTETWGGPLGSRTAHVYVVFEFGDDPATSVKKGFAVDLPWNTSMDQLDEKLSAELATMGENYGETDGAINYGSLVIY